MKNMLESVLKSDIELVNAHIARMLRSENERMQEIIDWILAEKGKQLRPKLACLSSKFGKTSDETAKMAAMLEIIHMASLVHDDIIDNSDMRRGRLSVQKKFGRHMAVYAGDYMLFCVVKEATASNIINYRKYASLYTVVQKMCYGEIGQDSDQYQTTVTEDTYLSNINGKTANLFSTACEIGALTAKAPTKVVAALAEFGKNLGLLFQIKDDLIDYMSSEEEAGKPVLQDFVHGIYTLPIVYSFENADSKQKLLAIAEKVKINGLDRATAKEIFKIVHESHGMTKTFAKAKELYEAATKSLSDLPNIDAKAHLSSILEMLYQSLYMDKIATC
ncbi:MAG: polyprenyl synthetase family protein [Clostridia bacterium]|nr:polyprenyl synthetase family protein [Clostridia bacterium]